MHLLGIGYDCIATIIRMNGNLEYFLFEDIRRIELFYLFYGDIE